MRKSLLMIFLIIMSVLVIDSVIASNTVNFEPNLVVTTIPVGKSPGGLCVNPKTNMVYVTNYKSNTVSVINGENNSLVATIPVGKNPIAVAVNPNTNIIYVANANKNGGISVINGKTNSVIATIPIEAPKYYPELVDFPANVAVDTKTNMIYVVTLNGDVVYVINGKTNSIVSTMIISNSPAGECGLRINQKTNRIYVSNSNNGVFTVLNGVKKHSKALLYNSIISSFAIGEFPMYKLAVNPNTNMIYAVIYKKGTVKVIDGSNNSVVKTINIGGGPIDICVNPNTNMIYVANGGDNSVSVIRGKSNSMVAIIPVENGPDGICVNPKTNMVYVSNQFDNTVSVIKGLK